MMKDTISFIIRNYNLKKEKYELGKEGNITLNKVEFKTFLNDLPIQLNYPFFFIEIYSNRLGRVNIVKTGKDTCDIAFKQLSIQFAKKRILTKRQIPIDKVVSMVYDKPNVSVWEMVKAEIRAEISEKMAFFKEIAEEKGEIETIIREIAEEKGEKKAEEKGEKGAIIFGIIILFLYGLSIASVFFMVVYVPIKSFEMMNFLSITFWIWLLSLTPVNIYVNISHMRRGNNKEKKTQIKFNIPVLDYYMTTNISRWFINILFTYGTLFLTLPLLIINLTQIDALILIVIGCIAIFMHVWIIVAIIITYYNSKDVKTKILQSLLKFFQEEDLTWNEKQYYLTLILEFKKKKPVSIGYYSKIYAVLMLLFSIIPQIF